MTAVSAQAGDKREHTLLRNMFDAAVAAAHPAAAMAGHLPSPPKGRLVVVGAGKAALAMAQAAEAAYGETPPPGGISGLVIVPDGYEGKTRTIKAAHASHPLPDERGVAATRRILDMVSRLTAEDLVLVLLSGGASALLCAPAAGVSLEEKRTITERLFERGAAIDDLNAVRTCLSAVKGGRLARAALPAEVVTLAVSDVVGDDPAVIGSGPTVPPALSADKVHALLARYGGLLPKEVGDRLSAICAADTPRESGIHRASYRLVVTPRMALEAAAACARESGYRPLLLGDDIEGEARERAQQMAGLARDRARADTKIAVVSGGEVTVTMRGSHGHSDGGPNREFALALVIALDGCREVRALVADSDGVDGTPAPDGPVAGAFIGPTTLDRARACGLDPGAMLDAHRSGPFFRRLGDEFITGPTQTNVNDLRFVLVN